MHPLAIISDIHGNLDALEAVLADIRRHEIETIICLGDVVGYGADPELCVRRVREACDVSLLGNHDAAAVGRHSPETFNDLAREAIRWTTAALSDESQRYLSAAPMTETRERDLLFTHASPHDPDVSWPYIFPGQDVADVFAATDARVMFIGHTHVPGAATADRPTLEHLGEGPLALESNGRALINVGSVGQPRDRDPRAAWGRLDLANGCYEQHRVAYDVESAQRKIVDGGLPAMLADRLARGV